MCRQFGDMHPFVKGRVFDAGSRCVQSCVQPGQLLLLGLDICACGCRRAARKKVKRASGVWRRQEATVTETAAMIDDRKRLTMTNGWSPTMRPDAGRRNGLAAPQAADLAGDFATEPAAPCTVVIEPRIVFRDCVLASL